MLTCTVRRSHCCLFAAAALAIHDRSGVLASVSAAAAAAAAAAGGGGGAAPLEAALAALPPGVLQDIELEWHPAPAAGVLAALPRFAGATRSASSARAGAAP